MKNDRKSMNRMIVSELRFIADMMRNARQKGLNTKATNDWVNDVYKRFRSGNDSSEILESLLEISGSLVIHSGKVLNEQV